MLSHIFWILNSATFLMTMNPKIFLLFLHTFVSLLPSPKQLNFFYSLLVISVGNHFSDGDAQVGIIVELLKNTKYQAQVLTLNQTYVSIWSGCYNKIH